VRTLLVGLEGEYGFFRLIINSDYDYEKLKHKFNLLFIYLMKHTIASESGSM